MRLVKSKLPLTEEEIEKECKRLNITSFSSTTSAGMDKAEMQKGYWMHGQMKEILRFGS